MLQVAGSTQLAAGHGLHRDVLPSVSWVHLVDEGRGPGVTGGSITRVACRDRGVRRGSAPSGSARNTMACTTPSAMVKSNSTIAWPRWNHAAPGRSSTVTARAAWAAPLKKVATSLAAVHAVRSSSPAGVSVGPNGHIRCQQLHQAMELSFASGRHEGVDDLPVGQACPPAQGCLTFARARDASLRAATGVVSRMLAIVLNSKPKLSCRTKATRSCGERRSSTAWRAMPTVSASTTSSAGSGAWSTSGSSAWGTGRVGLQPIQTQPGRHGGEPGGQVLDLRVRALHAQPRLLDEILGLDAVADHARRQAHQPWTLGLEGVGLVHGSTFPRRSTRPGDD